MTYYELEFLFTHPVTSLKQAENDFEQLNGTMSLTSRLQNTVSGNLREKVAHVECNVLDRVSGRVLVCTRDICSPEEIAELSNWGFEQCALAEHDSFLSRFLQCQSAYYMGKTGLKAIEISKKQAFSFRPVSRLRACGGSLGRPASNGLLFESRPVFLNRPALSKLPDVLQKTADVNVLWAVSEEQNGHVLVSSHPDSIGHFSAYAHVDDITYLEYLDFYPVTLREQAVSYVPAAIREAAASGVLWAQAPTEPILVVATRPDAVNGLCTTVYAKDVKYYHSFPKAK